MEAVKKGTLRIAGENISITGLPTSSRSFGRILWNLRRKNLEPHFIRGCGMSARNASGNPFPSLMMGKGAFFPIFLSLSSSLKTRKISAGRID